MKLQIDACHLRLRLSEAELDRLLADGRLQDALLCPDGSVATRTIHLLEDAAGCRCEGDLMDLGVFLARPAFAAFAAERPRRDGFAFQDAGVSVSVDIDVRDSRKRQVSEAVDKQRGG